MKYRFYVFLILTGLAMTVWASGPNVLFIVVDDLRPEINAFGASHMVTPTLDALATNGVFFSRAYCQSPQCGPSRASFMSGLRPQRDRFYSGSGTVVSGNIELGVDAVTTLPGLFRGNGYTTVSLGKVYHILNEDYDAWSEAPWKVGAAGEWHRIEENYKINTLAADKPWEAGLNDEETDPYPDRMIANKAVEKIEDLVSAGDPFFLAVGFLRPHLPFNAPQAYWDLYPTNTIVPALNNFMPTNAPAEAENTWAELRAYSDIPASGPLSSQQEIDAVRGYQACVSYVDDQIQRVLGALDDPNGDSNPVDSVRSNTIVVVLGDHGWNLRDHGHWCKHSTFESALRTPIIFNGPGIGSGGESLALTELIDIYPTLADLCGLTKPDHLEGTSLMPWLGNPETASRDAVFSKWKLGDSIKTDQYRYTEWVDTSGAYVSRMLYDHAVDSQESNNISEEAGQASNVAILSDQVREVFFLPEAKTTIWTAPAGGNWSDINRWDNGLPTIDDQARFDTGLGGTIRVTNDLLNARAGRIQFYTASQPGSGSFMLSGRQITIDGTGTAEDLVATFQQQTGTQIVGNDLVLAGTAGGTTEVDWRSNSILELNGNIVNGAGASHRIYLDYSNDAGTIVLGGDNTTGGWDLGFSVVNGLCVIRHPLAMGDNFFNLGRDGQTSSPSASTLRIDCDDRIGNPSDRITLAVGDGDGNNETHTLEFTNAHTNDATALTLVGITLRDSLVIDNQSVGTELLIDTDGTSAVTVGAGADQTDLTIRNSGSEPGGIVFNGELQHGGATTIESGSLVFASSGSIGHAGSIGGGGSLVQTGSGALLLSGTNTFVGGVKLRSGSLTLSGGTALADTVPVALSGGTLAVGADAETAGALTVSGDAVLDLSGGGSMVFAKSTNQTWSGTLSISGTLLPQSVRFGTDANGLTYSQLRRISIGGGAVQLDANGYLQKVIISNKTLSGDQSGESLFVAGGGALIGTGTIGNLTAYALARVDPSSGSIGTITVVSNYIQQISSILIVDADNGTMVTNDQLQAGGTVDFRGTIDFNVNGDPLQEGDEFTVVTGNVAMPTYRDIPAKVVLNPEDAALLSSELTLKPVYYTNKVTVAVVSTNDTDGILRNGGFDHGMFFWETQQDGGSTMDIAVDCSGKITGPNSVGVTAYGDGQSYDLQLFQNFNVQSNETYTVHFKALSDQSNVSINAHVLKTATARDFSSSFTDVYKGFTVGTSVAEYSYSFTSDVTEAVRLRFQFGTVPLGAKIWIDDVKVTGGSDMTAGGFKVVGYVPAYRYDNIPRSYYANVDALHYSFIMSDENGDLLEYYQNTEGGTKWYFTQVIEEVLQDIKNTYGMELLVVVGGGGAVDGFDVMLGSVATRSNLITNLITFCNNHGFDGVDIDFEYPDSATQEQENYGLFIKEAQAAFAGAKTAGGDLVLTAAVDTYYQVYYPPETYYMQDRNHVMGYRKDIDLLVNDIFELFKAGAPMAKIYPGIIFSAENTGSGGTITYAGMYDQCDPAPLPHEVYATTTGGDTYYFNGIDAVRQKMQIARQLGCGGIMVWEFSQDSSDTDASLIRNALEDADADGMIDRWEERFSSVNLRPEQDTDGDGVLNADESVADTDPSDASSRLAMTAIMPSNGVLNVSWQGGEWAEQIFQERDITVPLSTWTDLFTNPVPTAAQENHAVTNSGDTRWYRIRARRP